MISLIWSVWRSFSGSTTISVSQPILPEKDLEVVAIARDKIDQLKNLSEKVSLLSNVKTVPERLNTDLSFSLSESAIRSVKNCEAMESMNKSLEKEIALCEKACSTIENRINESVKARSQKEHLKQQLEKAISLQQKQLIEAENLLEQLTKFKLEKIEALEAISNPDSESSEFQKIE